MIIDDDPLNNVLCKMVIRRMHPDAQIKLFNRPNLALESIQQEYGKEDSDLPTIMFLDINMPYMNGWDFLEEFTKFEDSIKEQFSIYIFTSSIDDNERSRAKSNPLVVDFLSKPLNNEILTRVIRGEKGVVKV